ncbi:hypothetical protein ACFYKT_18335 [Cytobacillus sp. FJAT-53684]|uniref:Uncharacterized protein n=1 Tax=Cytobacillus mangrovibacter TaxID=3299024 RepID=A0ABW6K4Q8_9BACI
MTNTINQLVIQINQTKKEIAVMDQNIYEIEMGKLIEIIKVAKQELLFEPVYETASGQDAGYYDEEEYFRNTGGEILNGTLVYFSGEFYEETEDGDSEISTEIFLFEDGSLKVFHTFTESHYCEDCEEVHVNSHRINCENQSLDRFDIGVIINNITANLKMKVSFLEEIKSERMAKLEGLKLAQ